jgi:hypothetical protein
MPATLPELVADKAELADLCAAPDVPHPSTRLPVVAKWGRPWLLPTDSDLHSTVMVRSASDAPELYLRAEEAGSRLLLQASCPGPRTGSSTDTPTGRAVSGAAEPASSRGPGRAARA